MAGDGDSSYGGDSSDGEDTPSHQEPISCAGETIADVKRTGDLRRTILWLRTKGGRAKKGGVKTTRSDTRTQTEQLQGLLQREVRCVRSRGGEAESDMDAMFLEFLNHGEVEELGESGAREHNMSVSFVEIRGT